MNTFLGLSQAHADPTLLSMRDEQGTIQDAQHMPDGPEPPQRFDR